MRDGERAWLQLPDTDRSNYSPRRNPKALCARRTAAMEWSGDLAWCYLASGEKLVRECGVHTLPAEIHAVTGPGIVAQSIEL